MAAGKPLNLTAGRALSTRVVQGHLFGGGSGRWDTAGRWPAPGRCHPQRWSCRPTLNDDS